MITLLICYSVLAVVVNQHRSAVEETCDWLGWEDHPISWRRRFWLYVFGPVWFFLWVVWRAVIITAVLLAVFRNLS
jgi:hypothetical protein